jgi:hypothetical protein
MDWDLAIEYVALLIQVSKVVHLITSTEVGRLSRRRGPQTHK